MQHPSHSKRVREPPVAQRNLAFGTVFLAIWEFNKSISNTVALARVTVRGSRAAHRPKLKAWNVAISKILVRDQRFPSWNGVTYFFVRVSASAHPALLLEEVSRFTSITNNPSPLSKTNRIFQRSWKGKGFATFLLVCR